MNELPILRIQLDGVRQSVAKMLADRNCEIEKALIAQLDETLTEDWVQDEIKAAINKAVKESIRNVGENWNFQNAIRETIGDALAAAVRGKKDHD